MGRRPKNVPDDLDKLLSDIQQIHSVKDRIGVPLPSVPISKRIMEFAQFHGALKYRDMREMLKSLTRCQKLEVIFFEKSSAKLPFKPDNWAFSYLKGSKGIDLPWFSPETFENGSGLIARDAEMKLLLQNDPEVRAAYAEFEKCWLSMDHLCCGLSNWVHQQFQNGTLEKKIILFKKRRESKKKTKISKVVLLNLIEPSIADVINKKAELPDLSVSERQSLQLLLNKIDSMNELELEVKRKILKIRGIDQEDPKRDGILVVVQRKTFIEKNYGNIQASGKHYQILDTSFNDLLTKKRKLVITTNKGIIEFCEPLIREEMSIREKLHTETEWKEFVIYRLPFEITKFHDQKYSSYPDDHFAQLRNTPPKTVPDKTEVRFFDFLQNEAPHKKDNPKVVRRIKNKFLKLIGGPQHVENRHIGRLAERVEQCYLSKAINMRRLQKWSIEKNSEGQEVYVFEY